MFVNVSVVERGRYVCVVLDVKHLMHVSGVW